MIYDSASTIARPRVKQKAKSHVAKARHARVASGYVIKHETCSCSITKINITFFLRSSVRKLIYFLYLPLCNNKTQK